MTASNIKNRLEIGVIAAVTLFSFGVVFNAGMQYARINNIQEVQKVHNMKLTKLRDALNPIQTQLAKQSQLLTDIKSMLLKKGSKS